MGFTLISIVAIAVGVISINNINNYHLSRNIRSTLEIFGSIGFIAGSICLLLCIMATLFTIVNYDIDYQNKLYEKEMLEYRIEQIDEDITGNEMLYNDIVEFNNDLRHTKKWANNLWTNWFYNQKIASIDYVELDGK